MCPILPGSVDADLLPNGNLLVCGAQAGAVLENHRDRKLAWSFEQGLTQPWTPCACPNGNALISDFDNHHLLDVGPPARSRTNTGDSTIP